MTALKIIRLARIAAPTAALIFGLGVSAAYADHEPGHKKLMETPQRGGDVQPGHEAMTGNEPARGSEERVEAPLRGGEIEMKHEDMTTGGEHAPGHQEEMETPKRGGVQ